MEPALKPADIYINRGGKPEYYRVDFMASHHGVPVVVHQHCKSGTRYVLTPAEFHMRFKSADAEAAAKQVGLFTG